ncbi:RNA-directed DNA polymerase-like protein [Cucumis melo var. makuwa]|uniref:RNA-directed DNA polymerase-like protein n=1 Tax=Cucumis melo var. makuwa TaxID=1194695 RepID=A0A5D3E0Z4_CUCMM|nr:RNA-directed DNA polymerase-like protein [Cucumis melo var. makuwa]TYK29767.1 RNA-directed DNA polymerase-like protein [Cucumis melo var. makuwa]
MLKLFIDLSNDFRTTIETIKVEMKEKVNLTTRVGNQTLNQAYSVSSKFKIPELKPFNGNRNAKELEIFIFDMKEYFKASGTNSEETKMILAPMCLMMQNSEFIARRKLQELKHTRTIIEYAKQFSDVMLDIRDMSEKDKVPHRIAECPHRGSLTALQASLQCYNNLEVETEMEREDAPQMGVLKILSAIQKKASYQKDAFEKGLMFVDAVINSKPAKSTMKVLNEYVDIMPPELPKSLPPRRGIDHKIELVPGTKPPTKNAYQMVPPELAEFWKQLDKLLAPNLSDLRKRLWHPYVVSEEERQNTPTV